MRGEPEVAPATSPSLLIRLRDFGDDESWQLFESLYGPIIRIYCERRGLQPVDVEDLTQNVLSRVMQAIRNFEYDPSRGKFRAWLLTVTANALRDYYSRNTQDHPLAPAVDQQDHRFEDVIWLEVFAKQVMATACERIQPDFDKNTWLCFWRSWMDLKPVNEIANELGVAIHSVYVNKSRVLKRLEQEVIQLVGEY